MSSNHHAEPTSSSTSSTSSGPTKRLNAISEEDKTVEHPPKLHKVNHNPQPSIQSHDATATTHISTTASSSSSSSSLSGSAIAENNPPPSGPALGDLLQHVEETNNKFDQWINHYFPPSSDNTNSTASSNSTAASTSSANSTTEQLSSLIRDRDREILDSSTRTAWKDMAVDGIRLMVFGGKRAGKSSLLGALIGQGKRLLPERTAAQSFTMVPVEIGQGDMNNNHRYVVKVQFVSKCQWMEQRKMLIKELLDLDVSGVVSNMIDHNDEQKQVAESKSQNESIMDIEDDEDDDDDINYDDNATVPSFSLPALNIPASEQDYAEDTDDLEHWLFSHRSDTAGHPLRALYRKLDMSTESNDIAPRGRCNDVNELKELLKRWNADPELDEPIVNDILLDPINKQDYNYAACPEFYFGISDDDIRHLNNLLFRIGVDHMNESLLSELFRHDPTQGMHVYESLQNMYDIDYANIASLSTACEALIRCLPIGCPNTPTQALCVLSLWPLIAKISVEVPPCHWMHLPPNIVFYDTPGTSIQLAADRNKEKDAQPTASKDNDENVMNKKDTSWINTLNINHVWLVNLPEIAGAEPASLRDNLYKLAERNVALVQNTDVIIPKLDETLRKTGFAESDLINEIRNIRKARSHVLSHFKREAAQQPKTNNSILSLSNMSQDFHVSTFNYQASLNIPHRDRAEELTFKSIREFAGLHPKFAHGNFPSLLQHLRRLSHSLICKAHESLSNAISARINSAVTRDSTPAPLTDKSPSIVEQQFSLLDSAVAFVADGIKSHISSIIRSQVNIPVCLQADKIDVTIMNTTVHGKHDKSNARSLTAWLNKQSGEYNSCKGEPFSAAKLMMQIYFEQQRQITLAFTSFIEEIHANVSDYISIPSQEDKKKKNICKMIRKFIAEWIQIQRNQSIDQAMVSEFEAWHSSMKDLSILTTHIVTPLRSKLDLEKLELDRTQCTSREGFETDLLDSMLNLVDGSTLKVKWRKHISLVKPCINHIIEFLTNEENMKKIVETINQKVHAQIQGLYSPFDRLALRIVEELKTILQERFLHSSKLSNVSVDALADLKLLDQCLSSIDINTGIKSTSTTTPKSIVFAFEKKQNDHQQALQQAKAAAAAAKAKQKDGNEIQMEFNYERSYVKVKPKGTNNNSASSSTSSDLVLLCRGIFSLQSDTVTQYFDAAIAPYSPLYVPLKDMYRIEWANMSALAVILFGMRFHDILFNNRDLNNQQLSSLLVSGKLTAIGLEIQKILLSSLREPNSQFLPPRAQPKSDNKSKWRQWWDSKKDRMFELPYLPFQQRYSNNDLEFMADCEEFMSRYKIGIDHVEAAICHSRNWKVAAKVKVWSWIRTLVEKPQVTPNAISVTVASPQSTVPQNRSSRSAAQLRSTILRKEAAPILAHTAMHLNPTVSTSKNPPHAAKYCVGLKEYVQGTQKVQTAQAEPFLYGRSNNASSSSSDKSHVYRTSRHGSILGCLYTFVVPRDYLREPFCMDIQQYNQVDYVNGQSIPQKIFIDTRVQNECEVTFYGLIDNKYLKYSMTLRILNWDDDTLQSVQESTDTELLTRYAVYGFTPANINQPEQQSEIEGLRAIIRQLSGNTQQKYQAADIRLRKKLGDLALQELHRRVTNEYTIESANWHRTDSINL